MTAKELCDVCDEDKAAISRAISYLEDNGYIKCDSKLEKRYKSLLTLTEKGEQVGKKLVDKIDHVLELSSPEMTDKDREKFYQMLTTISNNLQKISDKYGE